MHPLFDNRSFFRLATNESVWRDGGQQSVRDHFQMRRRQLLREVWADEIPQQPQEWGFGQPADQEIHELLSRDALATFASPHPLWGGAAATQEEVTGQEEMAYTPALVLLVLDREGAAGKPDLRRQPTDLFTGIGATPGRTADAFSVHVRDLPARRACLLFLVTFDLVSSLARELATSEPRKEGDVLAILRTALDRHTLASQQASAEARRRAYRTSMLLARTPALQGETTEEGALQLTVDLGRPCPVLDLGTWVALLVSHPTLGSE
jgi:hypothetical protein